MKFNIGDKVKSQQYKGYYEKKNQIILIDDIDGFITDAKPLGSTWIYKIKTDTGSRMVGENYLEIDKEWYRDKKIDSILTK